MPRREHGELRSQIDVQRCHGLKSASLCSAIKAAAQKQREKSLVRTFLRLNAVVPHPLEREKGMWGSEVVAGRGKSPCISLGRADVRFPCVRLCSVFE